MSALRPTTPDGQVKVTTSPTFKAPMSRIPRVASERMPSPPQQSHKTQRDWEVQDLNEGKRKKLNFGDTTSPLSSNTDTPAPAAVSSSSAGQNASRPVPTILSHWDAQVVDAQQAPPPTPCKKKAPTRIASVNFVQKKSPFQERHEQLQAGVFVFHRVERLGEGSYFNVYRLSRDQAPLIAGEDNATLAIKAPHGRTKEKFNPKSCEEFLENMKENYLSIQAAGLPVAQILNLNTMIQNGVIIQRIIPDNVNGSNRNHLEQVQKFFIVSKQQRIEMDLQIQNLRVKEGVVYLIDFIEEPDDNFDVMIKKACKTWSRHFKELGFSLDQAKDIIKTLTGNLYSQAWIDDIFI